MPGNLQSIPASVISSWPEPNYVDLVWRSWMPLYAGLLQGVTTLILGTRLVLRAQRIAGPLRLDDALLVPAYLGATMFTALVILAAEEYGMDRHIWDVHSPTFENTALMGWLAELAFVISTCCCKVSVLLFFRRLTQGAIKRYWMPHYATIGAIVFTVCYGIAFVFVLIFNCRPTEAYWRSYSASYTSDYTCTDTTILNPVQGALSVLTDFYSVILPMGMLWNLEATRQQKWALNAVFSLGLTVVGAGIVRTYYLEQLGTHYDITWLGFDVFVWSQLEIQLALICASAPALRVFFRRYLSHPITRAMNSVRSTSGKDTHRGLKNPEGLGIVNVWRRSTSVHELTADDKAITNWVDISQISDRGSDVGSPTSWLESPAQVTSADEYESYMLDSLRKQRTSQPHAEWRRPGVRGKARCGCWDDVMCNVRS